MYHWKGNYQRDLFTLGIDKILSLGDFMSDFREIVKFRPFFEVRKNFKLFKFVLHVVCHFVARDLKNQNI